MKVHDPGPDDYVTQHNITIDREIDPAALLRITRIHLIEKRSVGMRLLPENATLDTVSEPVRRFIEASACRHRSNEGPRKNEIEDSMRYLRAQVDNADSVATEVFISGVAETAGKMREQIRFLHEKGLPYSHSPESGGDRRRVG